MHTGMLSPSSSIVVCWCCQHPLSTLQAIAHSSEGCCVESSWPSSTPHHHCKPVLTWQKGGARLSCTHHWLNHHMRGLQWWIWGASDVIFMLWAFSWSVRVSVVMARLKQLSWFCGSGSGSSSLSSSTLSYTAFLYFLLLSSVGACNTKVSMFLTLFSWSADPMIFISPSLYFCISW